MNFCTNCGKPLDEGAMFCTSCGSPVSVKSQTTAAGAVPALAVAKAPEAETVPVAAPSAVQGLEFPAPDFSSPHRSGSLGTVLIVMVIVVVVGVGGTLLVLGRIHKSGETPASTATPAPSGANNDGGTSDADAYIRNLHLASYPGATAAAVTSENGENVIAAFQTRDTPQQVVGYYKVRFPISETTTSDGQMELRAALPDRGGVIVRATAQGSGTLVNIIHAP